MAATSRAARMAAAGWPTRMAAAAMIGMHSGRAAAWMVIMVVVSRECRRYGKQGAKRRKEK